MGFMGLKKADFLILAGALALAAALYGGFSLGQPQGGALVAEIYVSGVLYESIPLSDAPRDILVTSGAGGTNTVRVEPDRVYMRQADCPGQTCVSQGPIHSAGQTIACLPHRVLVVLSGGGGRSDVDAIAG